MRIFGIFLFLLITLHSIARQQNNTIFKIQDLETGQPIANASVLSESHILAQSDEKGNVTLPGKYIRSRAMLLVISPGYLPDTLIDFKDVVYLQRLQSTLKEVVISSNKVRKLFKSPVEYVVDYEFRGNDILICSYSGANGKNAKVFLLNNNGDTLALQRVPRNPARLYKSCSGEYYYANADSLYPISLDGDSIHLDNPYPAGILNELQNCQLQIDSFYYYKFINRNSFSSGLYSLKNGDSIFKTILKLEDSATARASYEEYLLIQALLAQFKYKQAARLNNIRNMLDRSALANINIVVFNVGHRLVAFDYTNRIIFHFNTDGALIRKLPMLFNWTHTQKMELIQDAVTQKIYLHRFSNPAAQTIEEVNLNTGALDNRIIIEKPFAENVKIRDNDLYFLWQNTKNFSTLQLYKQKQ